MAKWIFSMIQRSTLFRAIEALKDRVYKQHVSAYKYRDVDPRLKQEMQDEAEEDVAAQKELQELYHGEALDEAIMADLVLARARVLLIAAQAPCFYEYLSRDDQEIVDKIHSKLAASRTEDDTRFLMNKLHEVVHHPLRESE